MDGSTEFRILGPIEILRDGYPLALGTHKQRAVLANLLIHANEVVSTDRLIEDLWGDDQPPGAVRTMRSYVSRLRGVLAEGPGAEGLTTRAGGYSLSIAMDQLDSNTFTRLAKKSHDALANGHAAPAAAELRRALSLWRGSALWDFTYEPFAQAEILRLEELRLGAIEDRIAADLVLGKDDELIGELESLISAHPLRESFRGQLMLALYRSGRQAEALTVFRQARGVMAEDLGIEPSPFLQELERAILRQDPSLASPQRRSALSLGRAVAASPAAKARMSSPSTGSRRTVTVLSCDLADSTLLMGGLDPEAFRNTVDRYQEMTEEVISRHAGTMQGSLGESVMAYFGTPALHEDDALRAVSAAIQMRERLAGLEGELESTWGIRVSSRIGIDTGEALVTGRSSGRDLVTGRAISTASRLMQEAGPREILLSESTYRLVAGAVRVDPYRGEPMGTPDASTWRLVELIPGAPPFRRRLDARLVGREEELAELRAVWKRTARERTCHLFTIFGDAGIGKTRLANEFCSILAEEAQILIGRCLPYGEGITFWPLREVLRSAFEDRWDRMNELLHGERDAELIGGWLLGATGSGEAHGTREEIFWAVRKLLEALGRRRPLLVVIEDIHWAEPTFLDLIEHLAEHVSEAPIVLMCLARPELLEARPTWAGGKRNATTIHLETLDQDERGLLLANLAEGTGLTPDLSARVADIAEGNPLFIEQIVAALAEGRAIAGEIGLPPTIQALLASRLDRLGPGELATIQRAAIVGKEFSEGAIAELFPADARSTVSRHLEELIRKNLIRLERSPLPGRETFRFRHILIQNAAYRTIPKAARSDLHETFAEWMTQEAETGEADYDEIIGYHLEQAHRYRRDLGILTEADLQLANRASHRLASSGRRAIARGDMAAGKNLLERAVSLLAEDDPRRFDLYPDLGWALSESGEFARAQEVLTQAVEAATASGNQVLAAHAAVTRASVGLYQDPRWTIEKVRYEVDRAVAVFQTAGDDLGLARAWRLAEEISDAAGDVHGARKVLERALAHARRAGARREEADILNSLGGLLCWGPSNIEEAASFCEEMLDWTEANGELILRAHALANGLARHRAMHGRFDEARALVGQASAIVQDLGVPAHFGWIARVAGLIEMLAGDAVAAESELRRGYDVLERIGSADISSVATSLAQALYAQGRDEEAEEFTRVAEHAAPSVDRVSEAAWRGARARVLARRGQTREAEQMAREAVALIKGTYWLDAQADALMDLFEVLRLAGRTDQSLPLKEALGLFEQKGNAVAARGAKAVLAALGGESSDHSQDTTTRPASPL